MTDRPVDFQSTSLKPPPSGGGAFTSSFLAYYESLTVCLMVRCFLSCSVDDNDAIKTTIIKHHTAEKTVYPIIPPEGGFLFHHEGGDVGLGSRKKIKAPIILSFLSPTAFSL